jgi:hypothetical protein
MLINSMHSWSRENPNGNILLIAGDSDYVETLKFMEEGGHKVMIAGGWDASELLMEHGQVWWNWPDIVLSDSGSSPIYYRNLVSFISIYFFLHQFNIPIFGNENIERGSRVWRFFYHSFSILMLSRNNYWIMSNLEYYFVLELT